MNPQGTQRLGAQPQRSPVPTFSTARTARRLAHAGLLATAGMVAACGGAPETAASPTGLTPPHTRMAADVDAYHGVRVADPYRWLEDQDSPEVLAWADVQNAFVEAHLQSVAGPREEIRRRLTELWDFPRHSAPSQHGPYWMFRKNDGLQNQSAVYVTRDLDSPAEVLLDPNTLSADGTVALGGWSPSEDGRLVAFATSASGSDWKNWFVLDTETGNRLSDSLEWTKFTTAAWTHDNAGFFYQRYPAPADGEVYEASNRSPQLCYHRIGTKQSADEVVYERPDQPDWSFWPRVTDDGRYLIVSIGLGTDRRNRVAYLDLEAKEAGVQPLLMEFDASYGFIGSEGPRFFFHTDNGAPNSRIVVVDTSQPRATDESEAVEEPWTEVVPERDHKLERVGIFGGEFVATYLEDAKHTVRRIALDGTEVGVVELPEIGSVTSIEGKPDSRTLHFEFSSFTRPTTVFAYDMDAGARSVWREPDLSYDPNDFVSRQVGFQASDGARILLFLVHRKDFEFDGQTPTYLYGYGGFNISLTPRFSVPNLVWVERGGLFAQAILRGGGEFGEQWHTAGMLQNKERVFEDFLECADYLLRNDYTSTPNLAIGGRSNGGLLVGATLNRDPSKFGAAIPEVGVMDMLRYHEFTIGWAWAPEYGRSDDPEMFPVLHRYSPLHNVDPDAAYPPVLVMTGDHDDRVLPGHSYKYAAAMQKAHPDAPTLLRVQRASGHGAGKPVRMLIDEAADRWAFLVWALGAR